MDRSMIKPEIPESLVTDEMIHDSDSKQLCDSPPSRSGTNPEDAMELKLEGSINDSTKLGINVEIHNKKMENCFIETSFIMPTISNLVVIAPQDDNFQTNGRPYSPDHQADINHDTTIPAVKQEMMDIVIKEERTEDISKEEISDLQVDGEIQICDEHMKLEDDIDCPWVDNLEETVETQPAVLNNEETFQGDLIKSECMPDENTHLRSHAPDLPDLLPGGVGIILTDAGVWSTRFLPKNIEFGPYEHSAVSSDSSTEVCDWTSSPRRNTGDNKK